MTTIVVDTALLEKLHYLREPIELRDETGKLLAQVVPSIRETGVGERFSSLSVGEHEPYEPLLSAEELARRRQEPGSPLAEVLARLEQM